MGLEFQHPSGVILELRRGSLIDQSDLQVIVNAANCKMRGGGGIDGAIHAAAGPALLDALTEQAPFGCATGHVIPTMGFETGFDMIVHTPGPVWTGGESGEFMALADCYYNSLTCAAANAKTSIGFCSISTGIFKFPLAEAVPLALGSVCRWLRKAHESHSIDRIVFVMYGEEEFDAYWVAMRTLQHNWIL